VTTRLAIDVRMLVEPPDGVSRYSLELLRRAPNLMPGSQVFALGRHTAIRAHVPGARVLQARSNPRQPRPSSSSCRGSWAAGGVDLFHATTFSAPLVAPGTRTLLTLHDMI
jgi:hypothetical protein